jgi:hypothetical protein
MLIGSLLRSALAGHVHTCLVPNEKYVVETFSKYNRRSIQYIIEEDAMHIIEYLYAKKTKVTYTKSSCFYDLEIITEQ